MHVYKFNTLPFRFEYLVLGTAKHSVEYENKLYCCESEDKLTKFLSYIYTYMYIRVSYRILFLGDMIQATKAWGFESMLPRENFTDLEAQNTL